MVRAMRNFQVGMLCAAALVMPAQAVVVASGGPNNTPPAGQPFFNNVGTLNGASAIYLESGWVLTANHVAGSLPAAVNFGGISYPTEPGSFHRLENPAYSPTLSIFTDMVLFRLSVSPLLPAVVISSATPTVGSQVMMIGNGRTQFSSRTFWKQTPVAGDNNDTWEETTEALANRAGFKTNAANQIRWGENLVNQINQPVNIGTTENPVDVISFTTQFNLDGLTEEAQAVVGDSGGAAFSNNGTAWELAGMMFAVGTYDNQPGGPETAMFGNITAIADLSYYRPEILSIIPEPSAAVLAILGGLAVFRRRR